MRTGSCPGIVGAEQFVDIDPQTLVYERCRKRRTRFHACSNREVLSVPTIGAVGGDGI